MEQLTEITNIDAFFSSGPADVYAHNSLRLMTCRRFETVAKAIRFYMEELPARSLASAVIEVDSEERLDRAEVRRLYEDNRYPLHRQPIVSTGLLASGLLT